MTTNDKNEQAEAHQLGHQIGVHDFLRDVVRLMAYISVGQSASTIWRGPERDPDYELARFREITEAHLITEIPRLLISVAAMLRAKIDDGSWRVDNDEYIGWLSQGEHIEEESGEVINVRDACNKIIHAIRVQPKHVTSENDIRSIGTIVTIFGDRFGKPWSAELNLQAFCIAVANANFGPHEK